MFDGLAAGPATRLAEIDTDSLVEAGASIRHDGLELFLFRGPAGAILNLYVATRPDPSAGWSEPVNLGAPVNSASNEQGSSISPDSDMLFFASNRPESMPAVNGQPSLDIWVSTSAKTR